MNLEMPEDFALTDGERNSAFWLRLKKHFENQLETLRRKNDGALSHDETMTLRGQIRFLKATLALGDEKPPHDG